MEAQTQIKTQAKSTIETSVAKRPKRSDIAMAGLQKLRLTTNNEQHGHSLNRQNYDKRYEAYC